MSRGQLARTPNNFEDMRYRAERRHQRAAFGQPRGRRTRPACGRSLGAADIRTLKAALAGFGESVAGFSTALRTAVASVDWDAIGRIATTSPHDKDH
ncbi:hypothetical protein ACFXG4_08495 [Nocardia sp. NPDC059246]|uniref:hypothetical protein n=1 Tax=unclassified Nocardia TaxID=2637762 RepID=UPI0036CA1A25